MDFLFEIQIQVQIDIWIGILSISVYKSRFKSSCTATFWVLIMIWAFIVREAQTLASMQRVKLPL